MGIDHSGKQFYATHTSGGSRGLGMGSTYYRTTSSSFTFLTSTSGIGTTPQEMYDIFQFSIVNTSETYSTNVYLAIGDSLNDAQYIIYGQTLGPLGVLNPITTENRYFLTGGRNLYAVQSGSQEVSWVASYFYYSNT